ncbi:MAG: hypothetical protein KatS3mg111_1584 [Pirellulaceae bacterium]|nr:MAG: hypothetical protein KatS3mg111_1584 [Pirellulaceae bacterium]
MGRLATPRLFEGLDKTREWGESQYYRVPLAEQTADLIPPGAFWLEVLQNDAQPLLPQSFYLVHDDVHSRLAALAFIDLPLSAAPPKNEAQEGVLSITSPTPALLLSERYVSATVDAAGENAPSLLIGQELYMGGNDTPDQEPLDPRQLVQGVPYVDRIIVSNPSARLVRAEVLVQIPSGAIPLEGGRSTRTVPVELAPYHTQQLEISFYFPAAGSFEQYGAQVSIARRHVVGTPGRQLEVHRQPPLGDERSWEYLADWGQPDAILRYLERGNLLRIDLDRIAFRMKDHAFYNDVLSLLESRGVFVPSLWAYAVHHNDPQRIEQLLQHRPDLVARLGPVFDSPLIQVFPEEQLSFAHLEYRPLVLARTHPLGGERTILNPSLAAQYQRFMEVLAHQQQLTPPQRLQVVYYLLLQNRIEEALNWLDQVDGTKLVPRVQYDYLVAYTDLFRREYAHAAQVARGYTDYPSPRWRELFAQLRAQLAQRQAMLEGRQLTIEERTGLDPAAREFLDQRNVQQEAQAHRAPWIELREEQGSLVVHHRNVDAVDMRFYQMDVEVLFSRRPFASAGDSPRPIIHANYEQTIELDGDEAVPIDIPSSLRNQNLIVEAQAGGVSRRLLLTNSQLAVTLVEPYGRLIVTSRQGRAPVAAAYVKVYARHRDGSVKFYKDGYTDLRGHFDYATLSTNDMDTVEQFAILVLHPELGSMIRQAAPPAR